MPLTLQDLESVTCAVCFSIFKDPVALSSCGHSFCRGCVEACHARECPLCRSPFDGLVPNIAVTQLLDELSAKTKEVIFEHLLIGDRMHTSANAFVHKAVYHGQEVAVKEFFALDSPASQKQMACELAVLSLLSPHPNIVPFVGSCCNEQGHTMVVTKFVPGGSLFDALQRDDLSANMPQRLHMLARVADGLSHLHSHGMVHRDLKSHNIVLSELTQPQLIDFGQSAPYRNATMTGQVGGPVGTPAYISPEVLQNEKYGFSADIYSFGIVAWEVLTGESPFADCHGPMQVMLRVVQGVRPSMQAGWPAPLCTLLGRCWAQVPTERPTAPEVAAALRKLAEEARVDTSGTWSEAMRQSMLMSESPGADGQEICLACLEYNCGTLGFCSVCLQSVRALLPEQLLRSKEDVISTVSRQEVVDAAGKAKVTAEARARQDKDQTIETLRNAEVLLGMPPAIFRHLMRSLRSAATTGPSQLAALLSELGHPFLTAAQAAEVIRLLVSQGDVEYKIFHVLACRVVDQWNLQTDPHSIGHCYYGYHESDPLHRLIYPTQSQTLGAALCEMRQRSTRVPDFESFWSESETAFLMGQVRQNNVEAAFQEHKVYQKYTF